MVRSDEFFLKRWVEYYGSAVGPQNLYVYFDGLDQSVPSFCEGINAVVVPHIEGNVHTADRGRIDFLSARAEELFERYDCVIGTDVDEFLCPDPALGIGLAEYLSQRSPRGRNAAVSALGVDVGQKMPLEGAIDPSRGMLQQRRFAKLSTRYSKSSALYRKAAWGSGFHHVRGSNFHIEKDLYLLHFGCVDMDMLKAKMADKVLSEAGWERHLRKRAGTIRLVSSARRALPLDRVKGVARFMQNCLRPPYAPGKPAMLELKIVVEIPPRFKDIV